MDTPLTKSASSETGVSVNSAMLHKKTWSVPSVMTDYYVKDEELLNLLNGLV